jgi:hypothetical protein
MTFDFINQLADKYIGTLQMGIRTGNVNNPVGLMSMAMLADLLHGGAYACPVNQRPYFAADPTTSPYYAGPFSAFGAGSTDQEGTGIVGASSGLFDGQNAGDIWKQIMMDANCPHVLPKILSDEAYAQFYILYSQAASSNLFNTVGTGLKTYVEAGTMAAGAFTAQTNANAAQMNAEAQLLKAGLALQAQELADQEGYDTNAALR